ncbi:MAG: hypothetical protein ACXWC3_30955, partial [Burkholderiales bacterium]
LPLWLACLALARRNRERIFWALLALLALVLSFGFYVFGYTLLYLLPGGGLFRQQERLAFIVSFCIALLAGLGLNDLLGAFADASRAARKLYLLLPAGLTLSLALLVTFFAAGAQASTARLAFLGDRAGLMLLLFALASALVGAYLKGWLPLKAMYPLTVALILFDLFSIDEPANKGAVADPFPGGPLIEMVRQDSGVFRVADEKQLPGHFGIPYELEATGGISPLRLAHYDNLLALPADKLLPLLDVKYVFTGRPSSPGAEPVGQDGQTHLLRLNSSLPRAWLVGTALIIPDDTLALEQMSSPDFDPRSTAVLASEAPFNLDPHAGSGSVTIETREPERLALGVSAPADGVLLVAENDYPGWTASVDGAPVDILRADISLRAVPLRAGRHRVVFTFDPLSVKLGLAGSLLTVILCIFGLVLQRKSRDGARLGQAKRPSDLA